MVARCILCIPLRNTARRFERILYDNNDFNGKQPLEIVSCRYEAMRVQQRSTHDFYLLAHILIFTVTSKFGRLVDWEASCHALKDTCSCSQTEHL